ELRAPDVDPTEGTEALLAANDFPSDGGGSAMWTAFGARLREHGVEVLLTGDGGDEAVGDAPGKPSPARAFASRPRALAGVRRRAQGRDAPPWLRERSRGVPETRAAPPPRGAREGDAAWRDQALRCGRQSANVGWWRAFDAVFSTRSVVPFLDARVQDVAL